MRKLSTSTSLQCIFSLIPAVLSNVILHILYTSLGRLLGKLLEELHQGSRYCGVEEKEIHTPPTHTLCVVRNNTSTLSLLPSVLSVFISSGVVSRSSGMSIPRFTAVQPSEVVVILICHNYLVMLHVIT